MKERALIPARGGIRLSAKLGAGRGRNRGLFRGHGGRVPAAAGHPRIDAGLRVCDTTGECHTHLQQRERGQQDQSVETLIFHGLKGWRRRAW